MKHISILIPHGQYSIVNIAGAFQILNWANDAFTQQTRKPLFKVELVGCANPAKDKDGFYAVSPAKTIQDDFSTDLIILPAVHGPLQEAININQDVIQWVIQQYHKGAEIAAFCVGAFILAETGLLAGRSCSTHWGHAQDLQSMYPDVKVQSEKIVTESEGLYTSGGAYAFTNLIIYLIEKYGGRELAIMTSKAFMIHMDKVDQSFFMIFNAQKDHGDELVLQLQEKIEKTYPQKLTVDELAQGHSINRRTLERRFKSATGNSILEYLQRVRVESAKKILEHAQHHVADAMYQVGYNDPKAFREVFKKMAGVSPAEYRKKFLAISQNR